MDACLVQTFADRTNLTGPRNLSVVLSLSVSGAVILILNSILIICLVKTKELKNPRGFLLLILSISDCFIGLMTIPLQMVLFTVFKEHRVCTMESIAHAAAYFTSHFSGHIIAIISFQRNVHINPRLKPPNMFSRFLAKKSRVMILVIFSFMVTLTETLVTVFMYDKFIARLVLTIIDSVIIVYVYVTYFWMYFKVRSFSSKTTTGQKVQTGRTVKKSEYRFAETVALTLISTALCYFPYQILYGLRWRRTRQRQNVSMDIQFGIYLSLILMYCNSAINAAMIIFRSTKMRTLVISVVIRRAKKSCSTQYCFHSTAKARLRGMSSVAEILSS